MPTALFVDQSLVDRYLQRVDRFCSNVEQLGQTLKDLTNDLKERFMPEQSVQEVPAYQKASVRHDATAYQEPVAAQQPAAVTADDIDLDALLKDVDLGLGLTM